MKFSFLFLFLFLSTCLLFAQNLDEKPISITGFGKLQLGMSIEDIPELSNQKNSTNVTEIFPDTTKKYFRGDLDKRVRTFKLVKLALTENIIVNEVQLKFFENHLYHIFIGDTKMNDLVKTKYGIGKTELKEKEKTFQNGYGATFVKTDKTFKTSWIVDKPNVSLESSILTWHNEKGEKLDAYYIVLQDTKHNDEIAEVNAQIRKRIQQNIDNKNKVELKDF
jgi:hypothetical protein